jgi:hypothetical protein
MNDFCNENYKLLKKETEKHYRRQKDLPSQVIKSQAW